MHLLREEARAFCAALRAAPPTPGADAVICPSLPLLDTVVQTLAGSELEVGGQDLHPEDAGAHTGDVSGAQLADAGCRWAIVGHSERRRDHGEDDALVARKLAAAVRHGLRPILCLGETRDERRRRAGVSPCSIASSPPRSRSGGAPPAPRGAGTGGQGWNQTRGGVGRGRQRALRAGLG
jgi:triosephosphate isomerase